MIILRLGQHSNILIIRAQLQILNTLGVDDVDGLTQLGEDGVAVLEIGDHIIELGGDGVSAVLELLLRPLELFFTTTIIIIIIIIIIIF